jgi:type II secretory pathway pseudopilin PulG
MRLYVYIAVAILLAGVLWKVNGWRTDAAKLPAAIEAKAAAESALTAQREQAAKDAAIAAKVSGELATLRGKEAEIVTKIVSVPRKELVYVKVPGTCPVRSDSFRLFYNEAVTGSSAEPAQ